MVTKVEHQKCLWVEDFDSSNASPENFTFDQTHVKVLPSFSKAVTYIEANYGNFDTVILDIDLQLGDLQACRELLPNFLHPEEAQRLCENEQELKENAGFYLYLQLVSKGFPTERICFYTGNKGFQSNDSLKEAIELQAFFSKKLLNNPSPTQEIKDEFKVLMGSNVFADIYDSVFQSLIKGDSATAHQTIEQLVEALKLESEGNNTFGTWEDKFKEVGMAVPLGFDKVTEEQEFNSWFADSEATDYYKLRYFLIQASRYLQAELADKKDDFIKFKRDFYIPSENGKDPQNDLFSVIHFSDMLQYLEEILPLREPIPEVKKSLYKQIVRMISHDWEAARGTNGYQANLQNMTFFHIMKLLRNWTAHNKLNQFTERDVALFVTIGLRSFFALDNRRVIPEYELGLLSLHDQSILKDYETTYLKIKKQRSEKKITLNQSFYRVRGELLNVYKQQDKWYNGVTVSMYDILEDMGRKAPACKVEYLILMLWHGMCKIDIRSNDNSWNRLNITYVEKDIDEVFHDSGHIFTHLYCATFQQVKHLLS